VPFTALNVLMCIVVAIHVVPLIKDGRLENGVVAIGLMGTARSESIACYASTTNSRPR
jgi:hypothetical protein